jgi:hypothetical protein
MSGDLVPVAAYRNGGAWAAAETDAALLRSAGIAAVVGGDPYHTIAIFGGEQVVLLVAAADHPEAAALLGAEPSPARRVVDGREA